MPNRLPEIAARIAQLRSKYKSIHQILDDATFRGYVAKALLLESRLGTRGETTLSILTTRLPRKLLRNDYGFEEITPWKLRSRFFPDLDIYLLIQRKMRGIEGGEPFAYLQILEGNRRYQRNTWQAIMDQDIENTEDLKKVIMEIAREGFMSIIEEAIEEAKPQMIAEGMVRVLTALLIAKPRLAARYGQALEAATTIEEIRRLETAIMRDLAD